jgi:hypothetical protein
MLQECLYIGIGSKNILIIVIPNAARTKAVDARALVAAERPPPQSGMTLVELDKQL